MKTRPFILTASLLTAILAAVFIALLFPKEPSFKGKALSRWIWEMNGSDEGAKKEQARAVVRQLGSNSIPLLMGWLKEEDQPSFAERFDGVRHKVLFWLMQHKVIQNRGVTSLNVFNPSRRAMALWALPVLDSDIKKAVIPKLIPLLGAKDPKTLEFSPLAGTAFLALSSMAPESINPLIDTLTNHDNFTWMLAAGALNKIGPTAKAAIPALQKRLYDTNFDVRVSAASAIGQLGGNPDLFIPAVVETLTQFDADKLDYKLEVLVQYREQARPAIPALLKMLETIPESTNPTNLMLRSQIMDAIRQIAPETVVKTDADDAVE